MAVNWKDLGLETKAQAQRRHDQLCRRLERSEQTYFSLNVVSDCGKEIRCDRDGCPLCLRRFRKQLIRELDRLSIDIEQGEWSRISLIPAKSLILTEDLQTFDIQLATEAFNRRLARSEFSDCVFVGGWDLSNNWFDNNLLGNQLHVYGLLARPHEKGLTSRLHAALKPDPRAHRPVLSKPVEPGKFMHGATYAYKSTFSRRSGYFEPDRVRRDGKPRKNAVDQPLRFQDFLEISAWLAEKPVGSRLILRGLKRVNQPGSKLRLARV